jgi:hypothetical protein
VGRYLTNKLMERGLIPKRQVAPPLTAKRCRLAVLSGIRPPFEGVSRFQGQIVHVLLTRSPLYSSNRNRTFSLDLHVLGTPPAFVLSQDQTLHNIC